MNLDRLRILYCLVRLGLNPKRTDLVFDLSDLLYKTGAFHEVSKRLGDVPAFRNIADERRLLENVDLKQLGTLPEGTLGRTFSEHMVSRGFEVDFYRRREITGDISWAMMWLRQTHDLWHVVTGFDTDPAGEVGLQAFMLSQLATPLSGILVAASLLKVTLSEPLKLGLLVDRINRGILLGQCAKPLFVYDWEKNWTKSLEQVRAELNLS